MDGSCLTCSVAENLGLERGEDLSGMIGGRADIFHIQSCNCLKGSQGKPILAVSIKGHPYSGLGHWRLGCIFFPGWFSFLDGGEQIWKKKDGKKRARD